VCGRRVRGEYGSWFSLAEECMQHAFYALQYKHSVHKNDDRWLMIIKDRLQSTRLSHVAVAVPTYSLRQILKGGSREFGELVYPHWTHLWSTSSLSIFPSTQFQHLPRSSFLSLPKTSRSNPTRDDRSTQQATEARRLSKSPASSPSWRQDGIAKEEILPPASPCQSVLGS